MRGDLAKVHKSTVAVDDRKMRVSALGTLSTCTANRMDCDDDGGLCWVLSAVAIDEEADMFVSHSRSSIQKKDRS